MNTRYQPIPNRPGYLAGDDGHIYSIKRGFEHRLAERPNPDGYPAVQLLKGPGFGRRCVSMAVHKLIASAHLAERSSPEHEIRHLDGDKNNNRPGNLAWGTQKENAADRERHGRTARGEQNRGGGCKLTAPQVAIIKARLRDGATLASVAGEYGISISFAWHIKVGLRWKHVEAA